MQKLLVNWVGLGSTYINSQPPRLLYSQIVFSPPPTKFENDITIAVTE